MSMPIAASTARTSLCPGDRTSSLAPTVLKLATEKWPRHLHVRNRGNSKRVLLCLNLTGCDPTQKPDRRRDGHFSHGVGGQARGHQDAQKASPPIGQYL